MVSIPGLEGVGASMTAWIPQMMNWLMWGLLGFLVLAVIGVGYFWFQYKYKVTIMERRGSGGGDDYYVGKIRSDRARIIKDKAGNEHWKLLFSNKKIPPIPDKFVYGASQIYLFKAAADIFIPMRIQCGNPSGSFIPIDVDTKMWVMNEMKQAAMDYQAKSAWEQFSPYLVMSGTILFCLALVGVTIWLTFKYAGGGVNAMDRLSNSIQNFAPTWGGAPPG
jgi:hypothetical protein